MTRYIEKISHQAVNILPSIELIHVSLPGSLHCITHKLIHSVLFTT